jgi:hypothetical protein
MLRGMRSGDAETRTVTGCIVEGCPKPASWKALESSLVDYCDEHIAEWLRAEELAREDDRSCPFEEWEAKEVRASRRRDVYA